MYFTSIKNLFQRFNRLLLNNDKHWKLKNVREGQIFIRWKATWTRWVCVLPSTCKDNTTKKLFVTQKGRRGRRARNKDEAITRVSEAAKIFIGWKTTWTCWVAVLPSTCEDHTTHKKLFVLLKRMTWMNNKESWGRHQAIHAASTTSTNSDNSRRGDRTRWQEAEWCDAERGHNIQNPAQL